jgi:D-3-phosphoglycerate dehydrogenase / 2-oxoglutarate reductase
MAIEQRRVLVAGKIHGAGVELLRQRPDILVGMVEAVTADAYRPYLAEADAILIRTQPMTAADVARAPRLQIVSRHGVGFDAIDIAALNMRRIPLAIVGDVNSRAVAEHTLMLMLAAARRTVAHHLAATSGNWNERNRFDSTELDGKTLLILGFGRIGRRVAELAKVFGMQVTAFDPFVPADQAEACGVRYATDMKAALGLADFVSVHLPGGKGPLMGAVELAAMKSTAIIVNAARGGIIDEKALDAALRQRKLKAAALDVLVEEPPTLDHVLINNPYITISPHNAGLTEECAMRMSLAAARNILDCFDHKLDSRLVVNAKAIGLSDHL